MRNVWFFQYRAEKSLRSQFQQVQSITLYIPFLTEKGHLSFTFLWLLQLVNYLPLDIPKVWKRYSFRVEHPRIGHYMECPPPPLPGIVTSDYIIGTNICILWMGLCLRSCVYIQITVRPFFPGCIQQTHGTEIQFWSQAQRLHHSSSLYKHVIK